MQVDALSSSSNELTKIDGIRAASRATNWSRMMQTAASMMSASISKLPTSHHCTLKVTGELNTVISNNTRFLASKSKKLNNSLFTVPAVVAAPASTSTSSHQFASSSYGRKLCARAAASPAMVNKKMPGVGASGNGKELADRVVQIHSVEEFDAALESAESRLVVVEYAGMHSENSKKIYPAMVDLSQTCKDTVFLLVLGDETEGTKELCVRAGIEKVPHFTFYKNKEIIHEEEGIDAEQLQGDVLYYGDPDAPIHQLHGRADFEALLQEHKADDKLVIVDVGLKNCGPCVKVYPTFIKLSKRMADVAVFARLHGDESDDCMELLKAMGVVEVPTFLFIKDGKLCGRYVGSGKGELIGEILRHSGVRVTY